jgi:hypothetical protein
LVVCYGETLRYACVARIRRGEAGFAVVFRKLPRTLAK